MHDADQILLFSNSELAGFRNLFYLPSKTTSTSQVHSTSVRAHTHAHTQELCNKLNRRTSLFPDAAIEGEGTDEESEAVLLLHWDLV